MIPQLLFRMLRTVNPRCLCHLTGDMVIRGFFTVRKFQKAVSSQSLEQAEEHAPPFLPPFPMISLTNGCNLNCTGCWVTQPEPFMPPQMINPELLDKLICVYKKQGTYFFGLLGGEPLLYPHLMQTLQNHQDCYFQIFTNGTLLTRDLAQKFGALGNVTPLISVEGLNEVADQRRGEDGTHDAAMQALAYCREARLFFGIATSVCHQNIHQTLSASYIQNAIDREAHYLWYYLYRPAGKTPAPELALEAHEIRQMREFLVEQRRTSPILLIDAYWDKDGRALCPAASGLSIHITPYGQIEPCPIVQFSTDCLRAGMNEEQLYNTIRQSSLLHSFRNEVPSITKGCIYLENPARMVQIADEQHAEDSSGRDNRLILQDLPKTAGHDLNPPIPETHWFYRFAKKTAFFGLAAYG